MIAYRAALLAGAALIAGGLALLAHTGHSASAANAPSQGVACGLKIDALNAQLGLYSRADWSCANGERSLVANGIPNHRLGDFPNPGNPNTISEQKVRFTTTLTPKTTGRATPVRISGFALNGVKFDPGTAERCDDACSDHGRDRRGDWHIEALHQSLFMFGVDQNNAHVQPGGAYHYHGVPEGLMKPGKTITLVGFAVDGFPIYGRYGHADAMNAASPVRAMRSSWRLKARPDAGRPSTDIAPMGTFTEDYEYAPGSGDLDACNGRVDVTPDYPRGVYHYYITDDFPYVQRCVMGTPTFEERPPQGMGPGFGPPPGR